MSTTDVKNYDGVFQEYILTRIYNSPDIFVRCKNILRPEFFDSKYRDCVKYVNEYASKYDTLPELEDIYVKTQTAFKPITVSALHMDSVLQDVGDFCRHRALENAIIKGMDLVKNKKYGQVELLIKEAMMVSLQTDLGLDIYESPTDVIERLATMQGDMKSGWETLDFKLFGGFGRQELEIFAAESGGGKSVVLQNLAVNFSRANLKGVYITLELAEELVAVRIYGMLINESPNKVKGDKDSTSLKIKIEQKSNGNLRVKRLPESVSTVNDIEVYLRELQIKTGIKLDYVCVDYLDLLTSDSCTDKANTFMKDKFVSEELRRMANSLDLTVFTASQFNRNGIDSEQKSQSQISGGISKIFTADNVIYLIARKEQGEMIFDFQKTRNSSAVGTKLRMAYNIDSLRITDHPQTIDELEMHQNFKYSGNRPTMPSNAVSAPTSPLDKLKSSITSTQQSTLDSTNKSTNINNENDDKTKSVRDYLLKTRI